MGLIAGLRMFDTDIIIIRKYVANKSKLCDDRGSRTVTLKNYTIRYHRSNTRL